MSLLHAVFGDAEATAVQALFAGAGVSLAASLALWCRRRMIRLFHAAETCLPKSAVERLLLLVAVCGLIHYGATKEGGNAGAGSQPQPSPMMAMPPVPTVLPVTVNPLEMNFPTNFPPVTNLCFWGIERGSNSISLGVAWPFSMSFTNDFIDLYGNWRLASNGWERLLQIDVGEALSNAVVDVPFDLFPTNAMEETAFFRLASQDDTDGDGLSDAYEAWLSGTDPAGTDTDGDGIGDAQEISLGTDPLSADTDGDGLNDGEEAGYITKSAAFEWYDTTGWTTRYGEIWPPDPDLTTVIFSVNVITSQNVVCGQPIISMLGYETGFVAFVSPGDPNGWSAYAPGIDPLSENIGNGGSFMVAAYWNGSYLDRDDDNSYVRYGSASNGAFVVEFHDVKKSRDSSLGMTYQIIVPPGTGNVFRVSYLSSNWPLDGNGAVAGVQFTDIQTTSGYYNLTWDFAERGPILPQTTIEYHLGKGSNPILADTDGDGLDDGVEAQLGTDPYVVDTDGDGLSDAAEYDLGTNPLAKDTDGDGLRDPWEVANGINPLSAVGDDGAEGDPDSDGLDNDAERRIGTDPLAADTDGDGLSDGEETVCYSFSDPLPWLDVVPVTNLTPVLNIGMSHGITTCPLPSALSVQGELVTNITVDARGIVYLNRAGYVNPEQQNWVYWLQETAVDENCFTVVPYGSSSLSLSHGSEHASVIVGTAEHDGRGYVVVEFTNMWRSVSMHEWGSLSFQVAIPTGRVERICVRYADGNAHVGGWPGSVGVRSFDARSGAYLMGCERGTPCQGMGVAYTVGCCSDPLDVDTDGDGIWDGDEVNVYGTDPLLSDTDEDGISDLEETLLGTSPVDADTDGDGLFDGWEFVNGLDPLSDAGDYGADGDPDNDGLTNLQEQSSGCDPQDADADDDGLNDGGEIYHGTDPTRSDTDGDGLLDGAEVSIGTNPCQPDSDGDGMNDGWECQHGFDPTVDNATDANPDNDLNADPDDDGLTNGEECEWGTNPSGLDSDNDGIADGYDTDGDGVCDGVEIAQNSDPTDASDGGLPNSRIPVPFYFGDPSGSHSEKYRLTVAPVEGFGNTPASFSWLNENYGECETKTAMLKPGWKYEVRLYHAGTNGSGDGCPDYDYELTCGSGSLPSNVVVEDPDSLFGDDYTSYSFAGEGKVAHVHVLVPPTISAPAVVGVNNDDDNGNGTPDSEESGMVEGDDDLAAVTVSVVCPPGVSGTVDVMLSILPTLGTLWKDRCRTDSVDQSDTFAVSSGESSRTYFLESYYHSGRYEDQSVKAVFHCGELSLTNEYKFTFVERIAEPITTEQSGGQIVNPCCAVIGGTTKLKISVLPNDFPESKINWRIVSGSGSFSDATGREAAFVASGAEDENVVVQVDVGDCPGRAPQFTMRTTTMHEVKIYPCAIAVAGEPLPVSQAQLVVMLDEVNVIYRQVGLHFSLGASLMCVTNDVWATEGLVDSGVGAQIRNIMSGTDGLEVYFISGDDDADDEPLGRHNPYGIIVKTPADAKTLAHEIGHACGWGDIYFKRGIDIIPELHGGLRQQWMPLDWNNGTGCRFYDLSLTQYQIIQRLLMLGTGSDSKCDIPAGSVHGRSADGVIGNISVGRSPVMTTSPHSL